MQYTPPQGSPAALGSDRSISPKGFLGSNNRHVTVRYIGYTPMSTRDFALWVSQKSSASMLTVGYGGHVDAPLIFSPSR